MSSQIVDQLSGLIGCVIVQIEEYNNDGQNWPIIIVKNADNQIFQMEISCDAEGNGPGHIFLGLLSGENFDDYTAISNKDSWALIKGKA